MIYQLSIQPAVVQKESKDDQETIKTIKCTDRLLFSPRVFLYYLIFGSFLKSFYFEFMCSLVNKKKVADVSRLQLN